MITCKEIDDYLLYIKQHPNWINKDRKLLIRNVVKPTLKRADVVFDEETFHRCIRYMETNYYKLFPYEKFILAFIFMYDQTGEPVFPEIFIMEGRGNGKDGFMAPLANFFQTPLYGVKGYNIEMVANSEDQIKDTFKIPYDMLQGNPKLKARFSVTKEKIINNDTGSELRYNTSNSKTADGKRPGCIFFNEYHAYEDTKNIDVYESAEGKVKQFREIIITTQGVVRDGPLDKLLDTCAEILTTGVNDLGIFPFICRIDDIKEMDNREAWHKANPSLEYLPTLQRALERGYIRQKSIASSRAEFVTKRMNLPETKNESAVTSWDNILWASYKDIKLKVPRDEIDTRGQLAVIGIDYADIRDFASAGVLTMYGDTFKWRQHTWICAQSPFFKDIKFPMQNMGQPGFDDFEVVDEPVIPVDAMLAWCLERMTEYQVQKIAMDTYRYLLFKQGFIENGVSIECKDNPAGIVRLIKRIGAATGIIAPSIEQKFSTHEIDFGDSAIMRWYTNNTSIITDKFGSHQYGKIEPKLRKTDGFMAFVAAAFCDDKLKENVVYV